MARAHTPADGNTESVERPLVRSLGPVAITFNGLGIILGAGIYSVVGAAAGLAGDALWMTFLASGVIAALTALSYAELATTYPKAGAEFTYLSKALPGQPSIAVTIGVLVALSGIATAATVSIAFGGYLEALTGLPRVPAAIALLVAVELLNVIGTKQTATVNVLFTLVEIAGLVAVVVVGARTPGFGEALASAPEPGFAQAVALVFFAFLGFENIANLAEEAKNPERDLPIAIGGSLAVAVALYVAVSLACVALAAPDALAQSHAPLVTAVEGASPRVAGALGGIALFATANTALASVLVASRVVFGMARAHALPGALARVLPRRRSPWTAIVLTSTIALALLPLGDVSVVASVSSFAALASFVSVNVAVVLLRRREPERARPFRVPLALRNVPVPAVLGVVASLGLMANLDYRAIVIGSAIGALVLALDVLVRRRRRSTT